MNHFGRMRRVRRTVRPVLLLVALLVGATGCIGDSGDAEPTSSATSSSPETKKPKPRPPTDSASPAPNDRPFPADTSPDDGGHGSGNGLAVTNVRTAAHPGFDRVVFDLGGTGKPGWRVEYVAEPRADGSGKRVRLEGTVFLQVVLRGIGHPFDTGIEPFGDGNTRIPGTGTKGVAEIWPGGFFEGEQQAFIGLTGEPRPFRVFALDNPTRVVVDVYSE